jgi:repressor LexA
MAKGLTDKQARVYHHLQSHEGVTLSDLAAELKVSYPTLRQHVQALEQKGYISFEGRGVGRSPRIRLKVDLGIPIVGQIAAGPLSEALEHPEGYLKIPSYPEAFGLRVSGQSMADLMQDGDVVLLQKRPHKNGDICAVRVDGSEATLKYLERDAEHPETMTLRPHNLDYPLLKVESKYVAVDGVFSALLRGDVIGVLFQEPAMT